MIGLNFFNVFDNTNFKTLQVKRENGVKFNRIKIFLKMWLNFFIFKYKKINIKYLSMKITFMTFLLNNYKKFFSRKIKFQVCKKIYFVKKEISYEK